LENKQSNEELSTRRQKTAAEIEKEIQEEKLLFMGKNKQTNMFISVCFVFLCWLILLRKTQNRNMKEKKTK